MVSKLNVRQNTVDSASLFVLSLATLLYEINLTRLFSVTQYYHFAFLIIGFAMFGFGASGTCFALFPQLSKKRPRIWMPRFSLGMALTCAAGYILMNALPFDSFSIAWDWRQAVILAFQSLVFSLPFFCSGAMLNICFALYASAIGRVYATNLIGSACGCVMAMVLPQWIGGDGVTWMSALLGVFAAALCISGSKLHRRRKILLYAIAGCLCAVFGALIVLKPTFFDLRLSPYKGISYVKQYPDSIVVSQQWNGYSRVDVVSSSVIKSLPGLSYMYQGSLPEQKALFIDGDGLSGILEIKDPDEVSLAFTAYLPSAIAYQLKPRSQVLILEPRGGLEVWTALAQGSDAITVVESNPLITASVPDLYQGAKVRVIQEDARSAARGCDTPFDIVSLPLTSPYLPVRSGAYSLAEDYSQTTGAYRDYLNCLAQDGFLVITKWLQTPPSESLRVFTTAVTALENMGLEAPDRIVAYRGYNTMTMIVSRSPFNTETLGTIRTFLKARAFDLVFAPDIDPGEVNRHNMLLHAVYYETFYEYIYNANRNQWYNKYAFDVQPATDLHPFFGHFFKLSQTSQIIAELGKTWQPFGGAGYFVIILLLVLSLCAAYVLVLIPTLATSVFTRDSQPIKCRGLLTYGLIGLAFMLIEIPLTQRFILYLGHPAYAVTAVLFTILTGSGIGSLMAHRGSLKNSLLWIIGLGTAVGVGLEIVFNTTLNLTLPFRLLATGVVLFPLGVAMGMPFSQGMQTYQLITSRCIAYAWSVNGAASVVASVLAAFLALTTDFRIVYFTGLCCYAAAFFAVSTAQIPPPRRR